MNGGKELPILNALAPGKQSISHQQLSHGMHYKTNNLNTVKLNILEEISHIMTFHMHLCMFLCDFCFGHPKI